MENTYTLSNASHSRILVGNKTEYLAKDIFYKRGIPVRPILREIFV